jgi:hypothetical protein
MGVFPSAAAGKAAVLGDLRTGWERNVVSGSWVGLLMRDADGDVGAPWERQASCPVFRSPAG